MAASGEATRGPCHGGHLASDPINVGIVGYGYAGSVIHPALLSAVPGFKLCAVATRDDSRRQLAARQLGVRTFASLTGMLHAEDVQVVIVATPHDSHEALVLESLEARRHVVCEKVAGLTSASVERMCAAAARAGKVFTVFQNRRWDGDFLTVKRAIDSGCIGAPRFLELAVHVHKAPRSWRNDESKSGGLLFDWGAHLVDQVLQLVPSRVVTVGGFRQRASGGGETFARCHLRFESGQIASVEVSYMSHIGRSRWFVIGDRGTLIKDGMDPQEAAIRRGRLADASEDPAHRARMRTVVDGLTLDTTIETIPGRWQAFYENLHDALEGKDELRVKPDEARRAVAVLEAHVRAAREGTDVAV